MQTSRTIGRLRKALTSSMQARSNESSIAPAEGILMGDSITGNDEIS